MSSNSNIFHELGEVKGRLGAVEQTVSRIEVKLDNFNAVPIETFEKRRDEVDNRLDNHESRIDILEKRAIKEDSSFMKKLSKNLENKLVGIIVTAVFTILIWVIVMQNAELRDFANEIQKIRR